MAKSNYPNKLDTSVEIPAVRDNIVEIGSDVINSLRSAIFQIERTLGVNPQGAVGNSVAVRIGKALDSNGNIKSDALNRAGLLSGPITNEDVSKAAAIAEGKLRLNFPTQLLQDEISQIILQVDLLEASMPEGKQCEKIKKLAQIPLYDFRNDMIRLVTQGLPDEE